MYRAATKEFILSPIGTYHGVVTLAKPKFPVLEDVSNDVFMSIQNRKIIEKNLLITNEFNLFDTSHKDIFPKYIKNDNTISHLIRIDNKLGNGDFIFHDFWPFYYGQSAPSQLDYKQENDEKYLKLKLDSDTINKISGQMAQNWLLKSGDHINRKEHKLFQISIDQDKFTIEFFYNKNKFSKKDEIRFTQSLGGNFQYKQLFLSQDIAPAFACFVDLEFDDHVEMTFNNEVMVLSFSNNSADYRICIPTCDKKLRRSYMAFKEYVASTTDDDLYRSKKFERSSKEDHYEYLNKLAKASKLNDFEIDYFVNKWNEKENEISTDQEVFDIDTE
jgi:hypothetical protein